MANGIITKLPNSTIELIAAGEVITSPLNVIKELLENSLDAGASNIRIIIETGGMKRVEVIDNGCGIARADAVLLCQRHTTSKLASADDLTRISTFGFRGEALASISEMAEIEVNSFMKDADAIGWKANYSKGQLVEPLSSKYLQNVGTHIKVTKLFTSDIFRKAAMKSIVNEEKRSIMELVTRYAIHHRDRVTISLKEISQTKSQDLICLLAPMSIKSCFAMFFGSEMGNNLIEIKTQETEEFKAEVEIFLSHKKSVINNQASNFILFVNNRLVECVNLKKDLEALTHEYLSPKQYSLLHYISLKVPPNDVDVNMHPSKATIALHYQTEIISFLVKRLREKLNDNSSRQLLNTRDKTLLPLSSTSSSQKTTADYVTTTTTSTTTQKRPHDLVHNDSQQTSLKQFITADKLISFSETPKKTMDDSIPSSPALIPPQRPKRELKLMSVSDLRQQVAKEKAGDGMQTIKNSVFVGLFDHDHALIQHETKLYAINLKAYLKEQYYQFYLFDFGNFPPIEILPPGNKINFILTTYLEDLAKHEKQQFDRLKFKTSSMIIEQLLKHTEMYEDYFRLKLTSLEILTIPCIMPDEIPNLAYLGRFLSDLVNRVDYSEERECLRQIGRIMANFYSEAPANLKDINVHKKYHDLVETKLYVAIKNYLLIPDWLFSRENICQISDTKDLYKVFERC